MNEQTPRVLDVAALSSEDRYWARKVAELKGLGLPTLRSTAEKWAASITGILGVVGLAALFEGEDKFDGLKNPEQWLGKAAFFAAAVCALVAVWNATRAAQTTSKTVFLPSSKTIEEFYDNEATKAIDRLGASRFWAAVAAALVLASAALLWWGREASAGATVIELQGATFCEGTGGTGTATVKGAKYVVTCRR